MATLYLIITEISQVGKIKDLNGNILAKIVIQDYQVQVIILETNQVLSEEHRYIFQLDKYSEYYFEYIKRNERNITIGKDIINFLYDIKVQGYQSRNNYLFEIDSRNQSLEGLILGKKIYKNDIVLTVILTGN